MTYFKLNVELNNAQELQELKKSVEIFTTFENQVQQNLFGSCFNKYGNSRLAVQLNFIDDTRGQEATLTIARDLKANGRIQNHDSNMVEWREDAFVLQAHEIGTACTVELKTQLDSHPYAYQKFQSKHDGFMKHFISLLLRYCGYQLPSVWAMERDTGVLREEIAGIAYACAQRYKERMPDNPTPSFVERFIHAFLNCSTNPSTEEQVLNFLVTQQLWKQIADSWRGI